MGSICDMHNANRAAAVFEEDPDFLSHLGGFVGATIESVEVSVNDPIGTISALFSVRLPNGDAQTLSGPLLAETLDSGIAGFDLQENYEQAELRRMLEAAIANPENGLDEDDRDALREELGDLANYYS